MKTKKDIKSALSGIVGRDIAEKEKKVLKPATIPTAHEDDPDITDEMINDLEKERKKKVGRPKLGETRTPQERATFIMNKELVYRLKYIALQDRKLLKDVIAEAVTDYIQKWEKKNK